MAGALPQGTPSDEARLRTDGHPPMRIMGRFFIWEILNMPGVSEAWGRGVGAGEKEGRERVH